MHLKTPLKFTFTDGDLMVAFFIVAFLMMPFFMMAISEYTFNVN